MFRHLILILASCFFFSSCDALSSLLTVEDLKMAKPDISQIQLPKIENINEELAKLPAAIRQKIINNTVKDSLTSLSAYYTSNFIDSLKLILQQNGNLKINTYESFLIKYLNPELSKDTVYLTNLYLKSPKNAEIKSYEFDVLKDDQIFFEIKNLKSNKLKEIEILEGAKTRYIKNQLQKKETVSGSLKIIDDNVLTVKISNDNFIKNKGLFPSQLNIVLKKLAAGKKIKIETVTDTIVETQKRIENVNDTVYKIIDVKNFDIGPTLDISKNNNYNFNIIIDEFEQLIGWGYWIGFDSEDIALFNEMDEKAHPLIAFSKYEIAKSQNPILLPVNTNPDVELIIGNQSLDMRTFNYANNFAFFLSDSYTVTNPKKAKVSIRNTSSLYEYDVSYHVIAVGVQSKQTEVDKAIIAYKDFIKLTLIENE